MGKTKKKKASQHLQNGPPPLEDVYQQQTQPEDQIQKPVKRIKFKLNAILDRLENNQDCSAYVVLPKIQEASSSYFHNSSLPTHSNFTEFSHLFDPSFVPLRNIVSKNSSSSTNPVQTLTSVKKIKTRKNKKSKSIKSETTASKPKTKSESTTVPSSSLNIPTVQEKSTSDPQVSWLFNLQIDPSKASEHLTEDDFEFDDAEDTSTLDLLNIEVSSDDDDDVDDPEPNAKDSHSSYKSKQKMSSYFNWTPPPKGVHYAFGNIPLSKLPEGFNFSDDLVKKRKDANWSISQIFPTNFSKTSPPQLEPEIQSLLSCHLPKSKNDSENDTPLRLNLITWPDVTQSTKPLLPKYPKPSLHTTKHSQSKTILHKSISNANETPFSNSMPPPRRKPKQYISKSTGFFAKGVSFQKASNKTIRSKRSRNT